MVCNKVYWENINPNSKTKKAQLIFLYFFKIFFNLAEVTVAGLWFMFESPARWGCNRSKKNGENNQFLWRDI